MTIPDELVEIGAKALYDANPFKTSASPPWDAVGEFMQSEYRQGVRDSLTAILPHLYKMMMEPSEGVRKEGEGWVMEGYDERPSIEIADNAWKAMLAAFFKERFGIEIKD